MNNTTHPQNNFDFLRFVAATMVWYAHCYIIYGRPSPAFLPIPAGAFGGIGVAIFFVISGYFITASYRSHNNFLVFVRNRVLRIAPAMLVVILLSVFVLGPLATHLSLHDYFAHHQTWRYLRSLLIFPLQYDLPSVFNGNHVNAVNGSLWTLQHETRCYMAVAFLGVLGILLPRPILILFAGLWLVRIYGSFADLDLVPPIPILHRWNWGKMELALQLEVLFASGALLYLAREYIPLHLWFCVLMILLLAVGLHFQSSAAIAGSWLFDLALPYVVIYVGFVRLPLIHQFGKFGDFSYGMYLYAFPVQQLTAYFFRHMGFGMFMMISFLATLTCAVASWHWIEKPALLLKK